MIDSGVQLSKILEAVCLSYLLSSQRMGSGLANSLHLYAGL